jgi:hypothetical protein
MRLARNEREARTTFLENRLASLANTKDAICWTIENVFALCAHCGRDARGPSRSLEWCGVHPTDSQEVVA